MKTIPPVSVSYDELKNRYPTKIDRLVAAERPPRCRKAAYRSSADGKAEALSGAWSWDTDYPSAFSAEAPTPV